MQPTIEALAHALHVMLGSLLPSEYLALGRFGREIEFVSNADAFPARALDFAGSLPPTALVNSVLPVPDYETMGLDPLADRKARRAFESGLAWLRDGDTLLVGSNGDGFDVGLINVDGLGRWHRLPDEPTVERIAEALRRLRPE